MRRNQILLQVAAILLPILRHLNRLLSKLDTVQILYTHLITYTKHQI